MQQTQKYKGERKILESCMSQTWAVAAIAVIDRNHRPLYTDCYFTSQDVMAATIAPAVQASLLVTRDDELHLHFLLHAALDIAHERASSRLLSSGSGSVPQGVVSSQADAGGVRTVSGASDVRFLDKLLEEGRFAVHGFHAASGVRVLLVTVGEAPKDAVLPICRLVYEIASGAMCSPFRSMDEPLQSSARFVEALQKVVEPYSSSKRSARVA